MNIPPTRGPLTEDEVTALRLIHGPNRIDTSGKTRWYHLLFGALFHPFNILLCILAAAAGGTEDYDTMGILLFMVLLSSCLRFQQEWKSRVAAEGLLNLISKDVRVIRRQLNQNEPLEMKIPTEDLVPGDWVKLLPGDLMPADLKIIESKDLYISQASLTGEAIPVAKYTQNTLPRSRLSRNHGQISFPEEQNNLTATATGSTGTDIFSSTENLLTIPPATRRSKSKCVRFFRSLFGLQVDLSSDIEESATNALIQLDIPDRCFMGTSVETGTATAVVTSTGASTYFGQMAKELTKKTPQNAFQLGVRRISWIFFITMIILVPPVLLLQGLLNSSWTDATLFALSVAVGLTPEMLPMIVNTNLARGATEMAKKKCIVKNLDAIINMGGIDVLCTDKTGTLTKSVVQLKCHVDHEGTASSLPFELAYLNSHFQNNPNNPLDGAIVMYYERQVQNGNANVAFKFVKLDELPFDFVRRRMSVIVKDHVKNEIILICKGAVEEILRVCTQVLIGEIAESITLLKRQRLNELNNYLGQDGLRVIAVAFKKFHNSQVYDLEDESDLTFAGFVGFLDPPKKSTRLAIKEILRNNVAIKVLTGDSSLVCQKVCEEISLPIRGIVTSQDLDGKTDDEISEMAERATIFAKLTPLQKAGVVRGLKRKGHIVGFLGDGINDAPALVEADVGISVDGATDIAKESADIILLEKHLGVVGDGIVIGRNTYGNTIKYIVMAVSSNFGNVFSNLVASSWLPFLPMLPIHVVTQNLLYDTSQIAIPWDNNDPEFLAVPHQWSMKSVLKFMVWMGPWSSVFDITTFLYMFYYFGIQKPTDDVALFQTTWFTVGILTQTFIVHMIRTPKIPFIQSTASFPVIFMTLLIMGIGLAIPFFPAIADWLQMVQLPLMVYPYVAVALLSYAITAQIAKVLYKWIFNEWF